MLKYKVRLKYWKENFFGFNNHQMLEEKFYADLVRTQIASVGKDI